MPHAPQLRELLWTSTHAGPHIRRPAAAHESPTSPVGLPASGVAPPASGIDGTHDSPFHSSDCRSEQEKSGTTASANNKREGGKCLGDLYLFIAINLTYLSQELPRSLLFEALTHAGTHRASQHAHESPTHAAIFPAPVSAAMPTAIALIRVVTRGVRV